jgi:hypothetical protein
MCWAIALVVAGCATTKQSAICANEQMAPMKTLREIEKADPVFDLKVALKRKDFRFVGIRGYTLEVPGIERKDILTRYGIKVIEGTSDAIVDKEDGRLQKLARDYAKRYNALLMEYLDNNGTQ